MTNGKWFSAGVRIAVLLEGSGLLRVGRRVMLFRAAPSSALTRAVSLGRAMERSFLNADGQEVRHRLVDVATLDELQAEDLDGHEVYCYGEQSSEFDGAGFEIEFHPELSRPSMTGVR